MKVLLSVFGISRLDGEKSLLRFWSISMITFLASLLWHPVRHLLTTLPEILATIREVRELRKGRKVAIDSTSDDRVANNVMRHEYRVLSEEEKAQMKSVKDLGEEFARTCNQLGRSRELSLAITKIEEAVMWAVKFITKEDK
jgi:hypothetical protein